MDHQVFGLVDDWRGNLLEEDELGVVFTSSRSSLPTVENQDWSHATCDSLCSYHLSEINGKLSSGCLLDGSTTCVSGW